MRHILSQIRTVCYLSDHSLTQPLSHCNRSSENLYRTTHIVTNPIIFYYRSITFWHISHHISLHIKSRLDTHPNTISYRSDHILLQIRAYFVTDPNTLCKQRIDMELCNSGNGYFDTIWGQLCTPALFFVVEFCTLQSTVPVYKGLFFIINSDSERLEGNRGKFSLQKVEHSFRMFPLQMPKYPPCFFLNKTNRCTIPNVFW
jgi:hypothetical protein